jgi:hypothetical protein
VAEKATGGMPEVQWETVAALGHVRLGSFASIFWHVRSMSGKGAISELPIVRFLLIEGIGLDVIQASK